MFHVGQKVVCVDDGISAENGEALPEVGVVYTIRDLYISEHGKEKLRLEEIQNPAMGYRRAYRECGFYCWRFRPVRTTDISIFTNMLNTKPLTEKVE